MTTQHADPPETEAPGEPQASGRSDAQDVPEAPHASLPTARNPAPGMDALRWPVREGFYRPDYARCLTGVLPTIQRMLGRPSDGRPDLLPYLPPDSPRKAGRALLICVDAFGYKELAHSRQLKALHARYGTWITSVFPTITSCAMSSLFQALPPDRHGILGHIIWKDQPGAVVDMLKAQVVGAKASLQDAGFDVNLWKREPGLLDPGPVAEDSSGGAAGGALGSGYQLLNMRIVGSGLSALIYGDTKLVGYADPLEGLGKAGRMLSDGEASWVGFYTETIDTLSHTVGGNTAQMGLAVRHLEDALCWLADSLPPGVAEDTALFVVADHGQSDIHEWLPLYGEPLEWLKAHTRAVGNSGRVLHVYLDAGQEVEVRGWLEHFIAGQGQVFTFDEIKQLTGPESGPRGGLGVDEAWVRSSLGDLVVVLDEGVNWRRRDPAKSESPYDSRLVSQHGALSWDEMFIPLLCAPLSALREA